MSSTPFKQQPYRLYTDGSHFLEANVASIGGYLLNTKNKELWSFSEIIEDNQLNSKHEVLALEKGLLKCLEHNVKNVVCHTDWEAFARILSLPDNDKKQNYISRNPILKRVMDLLPCFETISFEYIPRNKNYKADSLAKQALFLHKKEYSEKINEITTSSTLLCAEQQVKNKRLAFAKIHQKISTYYAFCVNNHILDIYQLNFQSSNKIQKIGQHVLEKEGDNTVLSLMNDTLSQCVEAKVGFLIMPQGSFLDKKLRGVMSWDEQNMPFVEKLNATFKNFETVVIHRNEKAIRLLKDSFSQAHSEAGLLEKIKLLGEYEELNEDRHIKKLQQKEFSKLVYLMSKNQIDTLPNTAIELKEKLKLAGVRLKI